MKKIYVTLLLMTTLHTHSMDENDPTYRGAKEKLIKQLSRELFDAFSKDAVDGFVEEFNAQGGLQLLDVTQEYKNELRARDEAKKNLHTGAQKEKKRMRRKTTGDILKSGTANTRTTIAQDDARQRRKDFCCCVSAYTGICTTGILLCNASTYAWNRAVTTFFNTTK